MSIALQDQVYFGTYWQILDAAGAPLVLGGGFDIAGLERTSEGDFFAGVVTRTDPAGRVTDVILAFAGAHGLDAVQGESILLGIPLDEAARATSLYDAILADPAFADARIHVTGHSLGAGYTEYVLAYSLATYGSGVTDARADFVGFGAPNWEGSAARHFGIDPFLMESRFADYTAANDPVLINGVERIGTTYLLPTFTGAGLIDAATAPVAAHSPTTYASALGLPAWLSTQDQEAATAVVNADFPTGNGLDPSYGPPGSLPLFVTGSRGDDVLAGLGGNDTIVGGAGRDFMSGGRGADVFAFEQASDSGSSRSSSDAIRDFSRLDHDKVDLSAMDARDDLLGKQDFIFVQGQTFFAPGQVISWTEGNTTWIAANTDRDASAEFMVRLDGRHEITADDLILTAEFGWDFLGIAPPIGSLL